MNKFRNIIVNAIAITMITACAPISPAQTPIATQEECIPSDQWTIHFERTGGFAGFNDQVDISSDGLLTMTNPRTGKSISMQLDLDQIVRLENLITMTCPLSQDEEVPTCPDCFIYTLSINIGGVIYSTAASDLNLPESTAFPLFQELINLLEQASRLNP